MVETKRVGKRRRAPDVARAKNLGVMPVRRETGFREPRSRSATPANAIPPADISLPLIQKLVSNDNNPVHSLDITKLLAC